MLSHHASVRCQQRAIRHDLLRDLLFHADLEFHIGNNCRLIRVSRSHAARERLDQRLSRYAVIVSDDSHSVVTAYPVRSRAAISRSRRA
jgi:hypothetical protein